MPLRVAARPDQSLDHARYAQPKRNPSHIQSTKVQTTDSHALCQRVNQLTIHLGVITRLTVRLCDAF